MSYFGVDSNLLNLCGEKIAEIIEQVAAAELTDKVYAYRTLEDKLDVSTIVSLRQWRYGDGTTASDDMIAVYEVGTLVKFSKEDEASLQTAETTLNSIEWKIAASILTGDALWRNQEIWSRVDLPYWNERPPNPVNRPLSRYGTIMIRVII